MTDKAAARANLKNAIHQVVTLGVVPYMATKQRDPREPDREEKDAAEERLAKIMRRVFRKQAKLVKEVLEASYPERKAFIGNPTILADWDEEDIGDLIAELTRQVTGGVTLFGRSLKPMIDYTLTNVEAAKWARKYAYDLIKNIDKTTVEAMRGAITMFVETPGFTIGDLINILPFDEMRASRVAVTEVTRTYAQGQLMAGEEMRAQFPDVRMTKMWFTNNDDRVCPICAPLDGKEIDFDENFYEITDDYQDGNPPAHVNCRCWIDTGTRLPGE